MSDPGPVRKDRLDLLAVSILLVCCLLLTLIWAKDVRYALICLPAIVIALAEGCRGWHQHVVSRLVLPGLTNWVLSGLAVLAGLSSMILVDVLGPTPLMLSRSAALALLTSTPARQDRLATDSRAEIRNLRMKTP